MTASDARYRTKVYLDAYIVDANITTDTPATASNTVMYAYPPYPLRLLFSSTEKDFDVIFFVDKPTSKGRYTSARTLYGYEESIPIHCHAITKSDVTPEKILWLAEAELRRVLENYPYGSVRWLSETKTHTIHEESTVFYGFTLVLNYVRDYTA